MSECETLIKLSPAVPRMISYTGSNFHKIPQLVRLNAEQKEVIAVVSQVLPFKVNHYVLDELIDWDNIPADPIFQMTFPQRGMLSDEEYFTIKMMLTKNDKAGLARVVHDIRSKLNPHPGDQLTLNVPRWQAEKLAGVQHKYPETVLYFPAQGQTCHSYCTYCFRWPQFVGDKSLQFSSRHINKMLEYLQVHQEVTDILITGGDPLIAKTTHLASYIEPLFAKEFRHITNIRIGTKALTYWPQRFVSDADANDLLALFKRAAEAGKHIAIMAHYNHYNELQTDIAQIAIQRLQDNHVTIRSQAPLLRHINDDATVWELLWKAQVRLGIIPYYMFVERDTGAKDYFSVPLREALAIFRHAYQRVSGLCRTVRGPVMSTSAGKVIVEDILQMQKEKVFVLKFLQARDINRVGKLFFARYQDDATWFDELHLLETEEV
jgi:KamA family protein